MKKRTWESKQTKTGKNQQNNCTTSKRKSTEKLNNWFAALENKTDWVFIKFDIQEFYLSITEDILKTSESFANEYQYTTEEDICIINHSRKSLLFSDNQPWNKKGT